MKGEGEEKITKVRKRMVKLGKLKQKPAGREMRTLVKQDMLRCEKKTSKEDFSVEIIPYLDLLSCKTSTLNKLTVSNFAKNA